MTLHRVPVASPGAEQICLRRGTDVAFYHELVDVTVDGVAMERPVSVLSQAGNRPSSPPT